MTLLSLVISPLSLVLFLVASGLVFLVFSWIRRIALRTVFLSFVALLVWSQIVPQVYGLLAPHQKDRIDVVLGKGGDDWNLVQSKIAIGSGKVTGKGYTKELRQSLILCPSKTQTSFFQLSEKKEGCWAPWVYCFFLLCLSFE